MSYGDAFPLKDADGNEVLRGASRISGGTIQTAGDRNETPDSEGTGASLQSMIVSTQIHKYKHQLKHAASGNFFMLGCH